MKRFKMTALFLTAMITASLFTGCGGANANKSPEKSAEKVTLNVYNWGDYIGENVVDNFKKKYPDINVIYEVYDTNEIMYVKLKSGSANYDVAIPSDYMIKRMIDENMLNKINMDNIPNMQYIDSRFKKLGYDPKDEYSVPYMWGTVGILYNKTMVKDPVDSWKILWNKKYSKQIIMPDSVRDSVGITLKMLGLSMNTKKTEDLELAKKTLMEQKPLVLSYLVDQVKDKMIGGEAALAVVWSGDAFYCINENSDLEYAIPKEGTNLWFDGMVIPKTAKHQKEAEIFINYMCETDTAVKNAELIGYATPHTEAKTKLDPKLTGNKNAYPSVEDVKGCEIFEYPGDEMNKEYDRIWTEIKVK